MARAVYRPCLRAFLLPLGAPPPATRVTRCRAASQSAPATLAKRHRPARAGVARCMNRQRAEPLPNPAKSDSSPALTGSRRRCDAASQRVPTRAGRRAYNGSGTVAPNCGRLKSNQSTAAVPGAASRSKPRESQMTRNLRLSMLLAVLALHGTAGCARRGCHPDSRARCQQRRSHASALRGRRLPGLLQQLLPATGTPGPRPRQQIPVGAGRRAHRRREARRWQ